jgi:hypothetical protein
MDVLGLYTMATQDQLLRWSSSGLPGSWGVLSYLCPAHATPAVPLVACHLGTEVLPPQKRPRRPQQSIEFRGSITRLQYSLSTLPDSAFPTLARLASGGRQTLTGWDSNPLNSFGEFQNDFIHHLSQRPRLRLAPLFALYCSSPYPMPSAPCAMRSALCSCKLNPER